MAQGVSPVLTDTQKAKKKKGKCITLFCTKSIRLKKGKQRGNICWACEKKNYIKNHPLEYTYGVNRANAKRRKKYFDLTFEEFKEFYHFLMKNSYLIKLNIFKLKMII